MKSILIEDEVHEKVKKFSKKSGIKIKVLVEAGILYYISKMSFKEEEEKQNG
jgi:hypothetical protein